MRYQILASTAVMVILGVLTPARSQLNVNTDDPDLFLSGEADSCQGCDLRGVTLISDPDDPLRYQNIKLRQANLSSANLRDLDLRGSYFTCADLRGADLSGANLSNVDFIYANLSGANLSGADLSATTFRGAILDEQTNLEGIILSENTIAPNSQFAEQTEPMASVEPIPLDGRECFGRPE